MMVSGLLVSGKFSVVPGVNVNHSTYPNFLGTLYNIVEVYDIIDMNQQREVERSQSVTNRSREKAKAVVVYKNGDLHFKGYHVAITPRRFRTFDSLLSELTRVTNLPRGARYVFTPINGTRVASLEQLHNGQRYVCDSNPKLKKLDYSKIDMNEEKITDKKSSNSSRSYPSQIYTDDGEIQPKNLRPKMITAVRNGITRPHTKVKLLLNKRTAHTLVQVLDDITLAIGSDACIRKLYNLGGKQIQQLSELFNEDTIYIAVGSERFRSLDIPEIKNELGICSSTEISSLANSVAARKNVNSLMRKYSKSNQNDVIEYSVFNDFNPDTHIDTHFIETDPPKERSDLPIIKQYDQKQKDGRAQLLKNIDYLRNKGNVYIRHQRGSKVDNKVFNKRSLNQHKPLPSIHGSISITGKKNSDVIKPRQRRRKKRVSFTTKDGAQDNVSSPEKTVLPIFDNGTVEYRKLMKGLDIQIKQPPGRNGIENKQSINIDITNKEKKVWGLKYQDNYTIKDIFNDIFNINAHVDNHTYDIVNDDCTMEKRLENSSFNETGNRNQGETEEESDIGGNGMNDTQEYKADTKEDIIKACEGDVNEADKFENDNEDNNLEVNISENDRVEGVEGIDYVKYATNVDSEKCNEVKVKGVQTYAVEIAGTHYSEENYPEGIHFDGDDDPVIDRKLDDTKEDEVDITDIEVACVGDYHVNVNDVNVNGVDVKDAEDDNDAAADVTTGQDDDIQDGDINVDDFKKADIEDNYITIMAKGFGNGEDNDAKEEELEIKTDSVSYTVELKDKEKKCSRNNGIEFNDIHVDYATFSVFDNGNHRENKQIRHTTNENIIGGQRDLEKYINANKAVQDVKNDFYGNSIEDNKQDQYDHVDSYLQNISVDNGNDRNDKIKSSTGVATNESNCEHPEITNKTNAKSIILSLNNASNNENKVLIFDSADITSEGNDAMIEGISCIEDDDCHHHKESNSDEDIVAYLNRTTDKEDDIGERAVTLTKNISDIKEHGTIILSTTNMTEESVHEITDVVDASDGIRNSDTVVISCAFDVAFKEEDVIDDFLPTTRTFNKYIHDSSSFVNVDVRESPGMNNGPDNSDFDIDNEGTNEITSNVDYKDIAYEPHHDVRTNDVSDQNDFVAMTNDNNLSLNHDHDNVLVNDNYDILKAGSCSVEIINDHNYDGSVEKRHEDDVNIAASTISDFVIQEKMQKDMGADPNNDNVEQLNELFSNEGISAFYEIGEILGDGNFAIVRRIMDLSTHKSHAMKIIDAPKIQGKEELLYNEISIQRECNHPNLVKLFHDFHSPTEIYLVMELVRGGDFFDYISENEKLAETEASMYVRDMCSGIDYLHQRNIVHRDIKPENLLLCTSSVGEVMIKIADFGLARRVTGLIYTVCGTPTYVAPEILTEEGYRNEVDIWAAGVILYIMLCGFPPFRSTNRQQSELFELIETGEYEFLEPYWDDVSDLAKSLVSSMIVVNVKERFTAKNVLTHEWLKKFGLSRTNTILEEHVEKRTYRTLGMGSLALEKFSHLAKIERGEKTVSPNKNRRSRSGTT